MRISDWSSDVCSSDLFRLATFALPVYSAIGAGLFVHAQGYATAAMLLAGFTTGLIVYLTGQAVFVSVRSPLLRFLVALLFAVPAGFAGYQAMTGLLADRKSTRLNSSH